jgi:hypothetical protein
MEKNRLLTPSFVPHKNDGNVANDINIRKVNLENLKKRKLRIGLLDNTKPNTNRLLKNIGNLLNDEDKIENIISIDKWSSTYSNPAGGPAPKDILDRLGAEADIVFTGLGN